MASNSPGDNSTFDSTDVSRAPRIVFLLLFMVASFVGSLFIIIVLFHNTKLRVVQNLLVANMCVICIIDSVFNMSLILGSLIADEWVYGVFMCKANNFFMSLVAIETMLMLTSFSIDRHLSLRFSYRYEMWWSSHRIWAVIIYFWLHSIAFSIPFLSDAVTSTFRPQLHICTVTGQTSLAFLYTTLLVCFLVPLITIIVFHILNARLSCQLRYIKRAEVAQKNYTQMLNETPRSGQKSHPSSFTASLFLLWLILEVPFIITSYIKQYEYSQELEQGSVIAYPWAVDATFLWMRLFYSAVFPFVAFFFKKDVWQSAKECVLCRRHNSIVDMEIVGVGSDISGKKEQLPKSEKEWTPKAKDKEKENQIETPNTLAFNVPVLFATSTGICIEDSSIGYCFDSTVDTMSTADFLRLKGKTLDITYPEYEYTDELMGDTSDYDSSCETDPYSTSQPVSTRNVQGTLHRTRSMSDPEINTHLSQDKIRTKSKRRDFSGTSGADSGLDLSVTAGSGTSKSIKSKSRVGYSDEPTESPLKRSPETSTEDNAVKSSSLHDASSTRLNSRTGSPQLEQRGNHRDNSKHDDLSMRPLPPRLTPLESKDYVNVSPAIRTKRRQKTRRRTESSSMDSSPQKRHSGVPAGSNNMHGSAESSKIARRPKTLVEVVSTSNKLSSPDKGSLKIDPSND